VKIGKNASETLALLTVAYDKYAMKKSSVFEVGSQKRKRRTKMWAEYEPWCAQIED